MKRKNRVALVGLCALSLGLIASCSKPLVASAAASENSSEVSEDTLSQSATITGSDKIEIGGSIQLGLSLSNVSAATFIWASSDTSVATVKDGLVTGLKAGTVKITATCVEDLSLEATKEITVVKDLDGKYKVSFVDYDGTLLYETFVDEGATVTFKGEEPTRLNSTTTLYSFIGWDHDLTNITDNTLIKAKYSETDFSDYFFEDLGTTYKFIGYSGEGDTLTIPTSFNGRAVTAIGSNVIKGNTHVKKVVIPKGIDTIDSNAFSDSETLEEVNIPSTVYYFGEKIFYQCSALKTVTIENGVTSIADEMFRSCSALTSIEIPNTVTRIGENSFFMSGLTELTIPESVTEIGQMAFSNCASLVKATVKANIETLPSSCFSSDKQLTTLELDCPVVKLDTAAVMSCTALTEITLPDTLTTIGDRAFSGCTALATITLGSGTTDFGEDSLNNVPALNDGGAGIKLKEDDTTHSIENGILYSNSGSKISLVLDAASVPTTLNFKELGVTEIGSFAFLDITTITSISLDGVTSIGAHAFDGCKGVTGELLIPESCVNVGLGAFEYMSGITSINIQTLFGDTKTIPEEIFRNCTSVTTASIPDGIEKISLRAFGWIGTKFTSVNIPKSVTYIGNYAFQSNSKLIITYEGTEEDWKNVTLDGTYAIPSAQQKTMIFAGEGV